MSVLLIIATLSIPALAVSAATAPTHPTNATLVTCSPEQHGQMSKQWIELKKCYEDIINYYLHTDNAVNSAAHLNSTCKEVDNLKTYINKFIDKAQCFNRSQIIKRSLMMFYNLVNHTVKTDDFRDFVKTNGSQCLNNARTDLRSCIAREDVRNLTSTHFNYNYWVSLKLGTDYGCNGQNLLKRCIDDALDKHRECKKNHVNFFHSLIDFVSASSFCRNETLTTTTLRGTSNIVYSTTNMLLSTLAVLTLL